MTSQRLVAIVGGTGGLGLHLVKTILHNKNWRVIVLSRSSKRIPDIEVEIVQVSYDSHASLVSALKGVHTVICTIGAIDESVVSSQLALLKASVCVGVSRFVPSEWAVPHHQGENDECPLWRYRARVLEAVKCSGLEHTAFMPGLFMNYFAEGTSGLGHLQPSFPIVDMLHRKAYIPGTGDVPIVMTTVEDIALIVSAMLDIKTWPAETRMMGSCATFRDIVNIGERLRGGKFRVQCTPESGLQKGLIRHAGEPFKVFDLQIRIKYIHAEFYFEPNLAGLVNIQPVGIEDFMRRWWE